MTEAPLHRTLGLTDDEHAAIVARLGREPNVAELAMFSVMWSEHCSYKSSKVHLRTLPTEGPRILVGPGEDAGVVDVGDGMTCVFKMESHSHPSAVEPYQGAATGVGGIVRDVLAMGARPVALLDPLRFGPLDDARNRYLFGGVVAGIGGYGNCIGVPTVGGEVKFDACHTSNPTVNVMCVGVARADELLHGTAGSTGDVLVLIGAGTGRDGIGGVSVLASATLEEDAHASRPSVQIGDPFMEKLLIECCLELRDRRLLVGLKDLGGAGLTCATSESAAAVDLGVDVDLDAVPTREAHMESFEILISESQERMLAIVRPQDVEEVLGVCRRWGLSGSRVGVFREGSAMRVHRGSAVVADVPPHALADEGPTYHRPAVRPAWLDELRADDPAEAPPPASLADAFMAVLASPNVASKRWVYEQYDSLVGGGTVQGPATAGPAADAAVIRLEGTLRSLVVASDGNGRFGLLDPYLGGALAVAEANRNVACTGATPVAITNCLNFGNPERPEVIWQFAETVRGMRDACLALGTPVTGGNVSFYNESAGTAIHPTAVVGALGILDDYRLLVRAAFSEVGLAIFVLGATGADLGGSEYAHVMLGKDSGVPPALDLANEARLQRFLVEGGRGNLFASAHDCSEGGLGIALAEAAVGGGVGFVVRLPAGLPSHVALFSESASRVVVTAARGRDTELETAAGAAGVPVERLGTTGGSALAFQGVFELSLEDALVEYEAAIPRAMSAGRQAG